MNKRKRRMPTFGQWQLIRGCLGNGWGDGDYGHAFGDYNKIRAAISAFEEWLEDRYNVKYKNRII